jgi:protein-S-isoprenylcysteine O-methyltransferase Ste14
MKRVDRGEVWVYVQVVILGAIFLAPFLDDGWPIAALNNLSRVVGFFIGLVGLTLVALAAGYLGQSLTALPRPRDEGQFTDRGVYGIVRHPMYGGVILTALGWSLFWVSPIGTLLSLGLAVFFDRKSVPEEAWLTDKYPQYADYRKRVKKLIPWLY